MLTTQQICAVEDLSKLLSVLPMSTDEARYADRALAALHSGLRRGSRNEQRLRGGTEPREFGELLAEAVMDGERRVADML